MKELKEELILQIRADIQDNPTPHSYDDHGNNHDDV